jgi:hypothetical protein
MSKDLRHRITVALETQQIDTTTFEDCAIALLQPLYPGLSQIEGGSDFGRDADIYFPVSPRAKDQRNSRVGRVLATTEDTPRDNVKRSLDQMKAKGLSRKLVVLVTNRPLSAAKRESIKRLCRLNGATVQIFAKKWLINQLMSSPHWRDALLGVTGEPPALSPIAPSLLEQPDADQPLVARGEDVARLCELGERSIDTLVTGPPGSGKSRVLSSLEDGVYFLLPSSAERIADDIIELRPRVIVVDDAHLRLNDLQLLQRLRSEHGRVHFTIFASTWPDQVAAVRDQMSFEAVHTLPLLEAKDVNLIIEGAGVTSHRARSLILNQAEGRPGWALVLCHALVDQGHEGVLSGVALLDQVDSYLRRTIESEAALELLSCVAALRGAGKSDLRALASYLNRPIGELGNLLKRTANHGLFELRNDEWHVQPALTGALVARIFFSDDGYLDWESFADEFSSKSLELRTSLFDAATTGDTNSLVAARREIQSWGAAASWTVDAWGAARLYSTVDNEAARWAVSNAIEALDLPEMRTELGGKHRVSYDVRREAVHGLIRDVASRSLLPEAVTGLLEIAKRYGNEGSFGSEPPLKVLTNLATAIDPDMGRVHQLRTKVLNPTVDWMNSNADSKSLEVASSVIRGALSPLVSGGWLSPEAPMRFNWVRGVDTPEGMESARAYWSKRCAPAFRNVDKNSMTRAVIRSLFDLLEEWLRIAAGKSHESEHATPENVAAARTVANEMLLDLTPMLVEDPQVAHECLHLLQSIDVSLDAVTAAQSALRESIPDDLYLLLGSKRELDADWQEHRMFREAELETLADKIVKLEPDLGVARFDELAELAKGTAQDLTPSLARIVIRHCDDSADWLDAARVRNSYLLARAALEDLLEPLRFGKALEDVALSQAELALEDSVLRRSVVSAALEAAELSPIVEKTIDGLRATDLWDFQYSIMRKESADEVTRALLVHSDDAVSSITALYFAVGNKHGPVVTDDLQTLWDQAFMRLRGEMLDQHSKYRLDEVFKFLVSQRPELVTQWYESRFLEKVTECGYMTYVEPYEVETHIASLPSGFRKQLLQVFAKTPGVEVFLHLMVCGDVDLSQEMINGGYLAAEQVACSIAGNHAYLESLAPMLVADHGLSAKDLATTSSHSMSWSGNESEVYRAELAYFNDMANSPDPVLREVAAHGMEKQQKLLDETLHREHLERVKGHL